MSREILTEPEYLKRLAEDYEAIKQIAGPILVEDYGLLEGHHTHIADLTVALCRAAPELPAQVSLLWGLGLADDAASVVKDGLAVLKTLDGDLFEIIPGDRLKPTFSKLMKASLGLDPVSADAAVDRATVDDARRGCYHYRSRLRDQGRAQPDAAPASPPPQKPEDRVHGSAGVRPTINNSLGPVL